MVVCPLVVVVRKYWFDCSKWCI